MSQSEFVTYLNGFAHRMAIIQCSPTKKKKRNGRNLRNNSSIVSPEELPKYIVRFSSQNDSLYIEAINLSIMYQAVLTSDDLLEHLSNSGFQNCPWPKYFETLSSTFANPMENITLQKGKGGGYMTLNIKYPIGNQFVLNGSFNLGLIDEYCQNEDDSDLPSNFKENIFYSMFESALSQTNKTGNSQSMNNDNRDNKEAEDDDIKNESVSTLKTENMTLQRKLALLEQENMRLKVNKPQMNMPNTMDLDGLLGIDLTQNLNSSIGTGLNSKSRVRKERDPNMSLMNPRRAKRRKTGFKFAGSKKK